MEGIEWSESKFSIEDYMSSWREYITTKALWYSEISDQVKVSAEFHEELAGRITEVINRVLEDPPTEEQIANIQMMQEKLNTHYTYDCKAEAAYVERLLKKEIDKK